MDPLYYTDKLYPLQDEVIQCVQSVQTPFYLSGGTAASRGYLQHRFSDDLDFFVNDDENFLLYSERIINNLLKLHRITVQIILKEIRFIRLFVVRDDVSLKIEMINDVPSRIGAVREHGILGRLDTAENILANKITAIIDRREPKDFADIWGFCSKMHLSLKESFENAQSKAAGIFEPNLARILSSLTKSDWEMVKWIYLPDYTEYHNYILKLAEEIIV